MPFHAYESDAAAPVRLRQSGENCFQLLTSFRYIGRGKTYVVHKHDENKPCDGSNGTDLASVPAPLWGLIASHGRQTLPALLHDQLCIEARREQDRTEGLRLRREADAVFRDALGDQGVSRARRWEMWAAVSIYRYSDFGRPRLCGMFAFVVVHVLVLYLAALFGWPYLAAAVIAPFVTSWVWLNDAPVALIATWASVVVLPALVLAVVAGVLLDPPTAARELFHGRLPVVRPTVFRPGG